MKKILVLALLALAVALVGNVAAQSDVVKDPAQIGQRTHPVKPFVPSGSSPFCSTPGSAIDSNLPPTVDTIAMAEAFNITDLNVSVDITHTWIGDLSMELTSPGAGTTTIWPAQCGNNDDMSITIDDEAGATVCAGPLVGTFDGGGDLASHYGQVASGNWTLTITDNVGGDTGTLNEWCLVTTPVPVELKGFEVE